MRRGHHLLLAVPLGAVAAVLLWAGDAYMSRRDWLVGAVIFAAGLGATFLCVRELRRGGVVR